MAEVTNVSGPTNVNPVAPEDPTSPAAAQVASLPDPLTAMAMGDDMIAQVVALMAKSFREDRKDARKSNRIEESNIAKETAAKIKAMRDQADQIRKEGFASGMTMMVGGALTAGGAAMSLGKVGESTSSATSSGQYLHRGGGATEWSHTVTNTRAAPEWTSLGSGGGDLVKGGGQLAAAGHASAAKDAEADATKHDGNAEAAKRRADESRGEMDDARRMLDKVAEFLKSVRDSQNASNQAAMRRA